MDISLTTLIIIILITNIFDNTNIIISEYNLTKLSNLSTMTYEHYNNNKYTDKLKNSLLGTEAIDKNTIVEIIMNHMMIQLYILYI